MASSVSATNSRLSVDDWVQEGFRVLAEDGVKALTVGHLCTRLGVTKGSFYWHFGDMTAYRTALIDTWAVVRDEDRSFDALAAQPPRERLSRMMTALVGPRHWMLERAMREWARSECTVAAAVRASDRKVIAAVRLPRHSPPASASCTYRVRDPTRWPRGAARIFWKSCCDSDFRLIAMV
jgi:AcrR family transcriptional regulator